MPPSAAQRSAGRAPGPGRDVLQVVTRCGHPANDQLLVQVAPIGRFEPLAVRRATRATCANPPPSPRSGPETCAI